MSGVAVIGVRENIYYFRESVVSMLEYTKYDQLPLVLDAKKVADILGISRFAFYRREREVLKQLKIRLEGGKEI